MARSAQLEMEGVREMVHLLKDLPGKMKQQAFKTALDSGLRVVRKKARANARAVKDTGALSRSIDIKSKIYPSGVAYGAIGPNRKKSYPATGDRKTKTGFIRPANYAHLVEFGTSHSAAKPFLRPAIEQSQGEAMKAMATGLNKGLDRIIAKAEKRKARR